MVNKALVISSMAGQQGIQMQKTNSGDRYRHLFRKKTVLGK